jgi:hypothetical protein
MTERDYFLHLEFRITRELAALRQPELRSWWCDGFLPDPVQVVDGRAQVTGRVWMARGPRHQELWNFVLHLGPAQPRDPINWAAALPPENVTGWLALNIPSKVLDVNPFVAYPDGHGATE